MFYLILVRFIIYYISVFIWVYQLSIHHEILIFFRTMFLSPVLDRFSAAGCAAVLVALVDCLSVSKMLAGPWLS